MTSQDCSGSITLLHCALLKIVLIILFNFASEMETEFRCRYCTEYYGRSAAALSRHAVLHHSRRYSRNSSWEKINEPELSRRVAALRWSQCNSAKRRELRNAGLGPGSSSATSGVAVLSAVSSCNGQDPCVTGSHCYQTTGAVAGKNNDDPCKAADEFFPSGWSTSESDDPGEDGRRRGRRPERSVGRTSNVIGSQRRREPSRGTVTSSAPVHHEVGVGTDTGPPVDAAAQTEPERHDKGTLCLPWLYDGPEPPPAGVTVQMIVHALHDNPAANERQLIALLVGDRDDLPHQDRQRLESLVLTAVAAQHHLARYFHDHMLAIGQAAPADRHTMWTDAGHRLAELARRHLPERHLTETQSDNLAI